MKKIVWILLALATMAWAQGSGSVAAPPAISGTDAAPFKVTKSVTGVVHEVSLEKRILQLEDSKKKTNLQLTLADKVRITGNLQAGAKVRVQYAGKEALEIRVLMEPGA
jgi:hypothetical protein